MWAASLSAFSHAAFYSLQLLQAIYHQPAVEAPLLPPALCLLDGPCFITPLPPGPEAYSAKPAVPSPPPLHPTAFAYYTVQCVRNRCMYVYVATNGGKLLL